MAVDLRRSSAAGVDLRALVASALARVDDRTTDRAYLEAWGPTSASCIWGFNALYWKSLGLWEEVSGKGYESALPGGESDARNAAAARETILALFASWDQLGARRALCPISCTCSKSASATATRPASGWTSFCASTASSGATTIGGCTTSWATTRRSCSTWRAANVRDHAEHISGIVLDAMHPTTALGFLKFKSFFVYISNVYDNLPTDEIARINGHLYRVETRAYLSRDAVAGHRADGRGGARRDSGPGAAAAALGAGAGGRDRLPQRFADVHAAVRFWGAVWERVGLEERYVPMPPLDQYEIAPGVSGETLRAILEANGDVRMHVSNGAAASFVDTLQLLHPHGFMQCHDIFVTDVDQYTTTFPRTGQVRGLGGELGQWAAALLGRQPLRLRRRLPARSSTVPGRTS